MLTVAELLRDLKLSPVSGEEALDAPVRWVHISELADPTPWLSGGELLLTTGLQLGDDAAQQAYVDRLADHGLAGLGLGLGLGHDVVPAALAEAAQRRGFPVFAVPYDTPFIAVTERAFTTLVNEGYAVLRRSIAAQERLQRIVLDERGLDAIAGTLAALIGGAALIFDGHGAPLAQRTFRRDLDAEATRSVAETVAARVREGRIEAFAPHESDLAGRALALPVAAGGDAPPQAWVIAIKDAGGLQEFDRLVVHQAVTVVALELLRRRVADSTERRLAGDVLAQMAAGELTGLELAHRLEPFGLGGQVAALVVTPPGATTALTQALADEGAEPLVGRAGEHAVALVPGTDEAALFGLATRVLGRLPEGSTMAAGRAGAAADARTSFHEARCALQARALGAQHDAAAPGLATYRDLGSFALLLSLQGSDALRLFCASMLDPIEEVEGHYGGELVRSLEAFIEANGQWESAARKLPCHRHTLRYRMRRVEELTGRDLGSARDRIEFWLALRGRELVAA